MIAGIADAQHGVVTRAQLLAAGLSPEVIRGRVRKGGLLPVHRGVYRAGHRAPSLEARYFAAVLACGKDALLSGRAAAHLHRIVKGKPPDPEVITASARRVPGVRSRRARMDEREAGEVRGIPVTTVARTLVDLAALLEAADLARVCHEAGVLYGTTPRHVEAVLARRPNARGAARLHAVMRGEVHVTLSGLEKKFLDLLRENGLPLPRTNRPAGGRRVDCRWPDRALTVELDSYRAHGSRHAWEQDRRRDREAYARGDEIRRYTHGDVFDRPRMMLRELRTLLGASSN